MSILTIEEADYFQAATGNLKEEDKRTQEEKKTVDYTDFFAKNPHYRQYQREHFNRLRQGMANLTHTQNLPLVGRGEKFISHDGNSILTIKGKKITAENRNGEPDIKAMLDLAEAQGWQSIKFPKLLGKGSKAYRQELWLEASRRGIEVQGYKPTKEEQQKLAAVIAKDKEHAEEQTDEGLKIVPIKEHSDNLNNEKDNEKSKNSGDLNVDNELKKHSLSRQEAHKALMGVVGEFFPHDSPSYNDAEVKLDQCLAELYGKGRSIKPSHIQHTRQDYASKMPAMRERYYQATQNEQSKARVTEQQQKQQQHIHQPKQHNMELSR